MHGLTSHLNHAFELQNALSGIISHHRAEFRAAGVQSGRATVPLLELYKRWCDRLNGGASFLLLDNIMPPPLPTFDEMRSQWLPSLLAARPNMRVVGDNLEIDIEVPPPRKAHAR